MPEGEPGGPDSEMFYDFDPKGEKEIHEKIRNDDDYDDWEYGTEPIPLTEFL
jgi:hypothetical protein